MSLVETELINNDTLSTSIISTGAAVTTLPIFNLNTGDGTTYDMLSITNPCNTTANSTAHPTVFFDKNNKEVLRFTPDGEIFWRGKLIEMDSDIRQAVLDIRRLLVLNGFRNL
jgi:hypothetical protein